MGEVSPQAAGVESSRPGDAAPAEGGSKHEARGREERKEDDEKEERPKGGPAEAEGQPAAPQAKEAETGEPAK
eukprot:15468029-Alexandrium_andersonii.AAC.1